MRISAAKTTIERSSITSLFGAKWYLNNFNNSLLCRYTSYFGAANTATLLKCLAPIEFRRSFVQYSLLPSMGFICTQLYVILVNSFARSKISKLGTSPVLIMFCCYFVLHSKKQRQWSAEIIVPPNTVVSRRLQIVEHSFFFSILIAKLLYFWGVFFINNSLFATYLKIFIKT